MWESESALSSFGVLSRLSLTSEWFQVEIGGGRLDRPGLFFAPTILSNVDDDNYVSIEESFGPVMVVSDFDERLVSSVFIILVSL